MPKNKKYVELQNVRLFFDERNNTVRLTSTDSRFDNKNFAMQLSPGTVADESARYLLNRELEIETTEVQVPEGFVDAFIDDYEKFYYTEKAKFSIETSNDKRIPKNQSHSVPLGISKYLLDNEDNKDKNAYLNYKLNPELQVNWDKDITGNLNNALLISIGRTRSGNQNDLAYELQKRIFQHAKNSPNVLSLLAAPHETTIAPSFEEYYSHPAIMLGREFKTSVSDFNHVTINAISSFQSRVKKEHLIMINLNGLTKVEDFQRQVIIENLRHLLRTSRANNISVVCIIDDYNNNGIEIELWSSWFHHVVLIGQHNLRQSISLGAEQPMPGDNQIGHQAKFVSPNQKDRYFDIL